MSPPPVQHATSGGGRSSRRIRAAAFAMLLVTIAESPCAADGRANTPHAANAANTAPTTTASAANRSATPSAPAPDAPKGTGFAMPRYVIAGGGGSSSGGAFAISGTIGQLDADPLHPATGGVFAISGGFWPGLAPGAPLGDAIFANSFEPTPP